MRVSDPSRTYHKIQLFLDYTTSECNWRTVGSRASQFSHTETTHSTHPNDSSVSVFPRHRWHTETGKSHQSVTFEVTHSGPNMLEYFGLLPAPEMAGNLSGVCSVQIDLEPINGLECKSDQPPHQRLPVYWFMCHSFSVCVMERGQQSEREKMMHPLDICAATLPSTVSPSSTSKFWQTFL